MFKYQIICKLSQSLLAPHFKTFEDDLKGEHLPLWRVFSRHRRLTVCTLLSQHSPVDHISLSLQLRRWRLREAKRMCRAID